MDLGRIGIWSRELRYHSDLGEIAEAAAELEQLGYSTLWIPGGAGGDVLGASRHLLESTRSVPVAPGILNVWMHDPQEVATEHARLNADFGGRFLLGLGISHAPSVNREEPGRYRKPLTKMRSYLDELDAAEPPVPRDERILAALRPKMLRLSAERSLGSHPYFVPPAHTAAAREELGDGPLLAPEQAVVLERDPDRARALARRHTERYLQLPNYTGNLERFGLEPSDFEGAGTDRLVDAVVAWGDEDAIGARIQEHFDAGADHVCLQVLGVEDGTLPREVWRRLAAALIGS